MAKGAKGPKKALLTKNTLTVSAVKAAGGARKKSFGRKKGTNSFVKGGGGK